MKPSAIHGRSKTRSGYSVCGLSLARIKSAQALRFVNCRRCRFKLGQPVIDEFRNIRRDRDRADLLSINPARRDGRGTRKWDPDHSQIQDALIRFLNRGGKIRVESPSEIARALDVLPSGNAAPDNVSGWTAVILAD